MNFTNAELQVLHAVWNKVRGDDLYARAIRRLQESMSFVPEPIEPEAGCTCCEANDPRSIFRIHFIDDYSVMLRHADSPHQQGTLIRRSDFDERYIVLTEP